MRSFSLTVLLLVFGSSVADAQSPFARRLPPPKPAVSPYLNLFRSGNSTAFNYLTLVRPEVEFQKSITQLQSDVQQLNSFQTSVVSDLGETGHKVGYQTHTRYFMTMGRGLSSAGGAAPRQNTATPSTSRSGSSGASSSRGSSSVAGTGRTR